jgi:hypothetical protein
MYLMSRGYRTDEDAANETACNDVYACTNVTVINPYTRINGLGLD